MARYTGSAFGRISQKLGDVVGSSWKGIPYIRTRVVPNNPNTVPQQEQRLLFAVIVLYARQILSSVIQVLFDPFARGQSGYNAFCKLNLDSMASDVDFPNLKISQGSLEGAAISTAVYAAGDVTVTWSPITSSNGLPGDLVVLVVLDVVNRVAFVSIGSSTRAAAAELVTVGTGRAAADLKAYLGFYRLINGVVTLVSSTGYLQVA